MLIQAIKFDELKNRINVMEYEIQTLQTNDGVSSDPEVYRAFHRYSPFSPPTSTGDHPRSQRGSSPMLPTQRPQLAVWL